jgi:hypothetical protein
MDEFKKELRELFEKHGKVVLKGSIELSCSLLHIDSNSGLKTRELVFKFTEVVNNKNEALEHVSKYGFIVN